MVFLFDQVDRDEIAAVLAVLQIGGLRRHQDAARNGPGRPNRIGVTLCELLVVQGLTLGVRGLDAVDGTPVLDVKPYMPAFGPRGPVRQPDWAGN